MTPVESVLSKLPNAKHNSKGRGEYLYEVHNRGPT